VALTDAEADAHAARIADQGYTIVEEAIEPDLLDEIASELDRLERELGAVPAGNSFEGTNTVRVYNLLARARVFERVPVHASVLPIVDRVLDPGCLVSSLSSIAIDPGENAQPIHADDQLIPLQRPHLAVICNSMWAITDFTEENGATRIIPGSHTRDHAPTYGEHYDSIPAEMPRGSVLVWHGSLWHGGGANRSERRRTGIAMNYCAGYLRQQENQQLGIPFDVAARFEPRLQELCGFGIYNGLVGHIDKRSPAEVHFGRHTGRRIVWDV
jgi:ectoine hydroxylase-related dioxygenase (phytanoyl-CoA dioxygenase family)